MVEGTLGLKARGIFPVDRPAQWLKGLSSRRMARREITEMMHGGLDLAKRKDVDHSRFYSRLRLAGELTLSIAEMGHRRWPAFCKISQAEMRFHQGRE